jgi:RNA polymerase sigma-70 factor (ECF subfamily)
MEPERTPAEPAEGSPTPSIAEDLSAEEKKARAKINAAMDRYADGDDRAFDVLYDALAPKLRQYLLRQTRDATRADDLLQQTLLQLHANRGRFIRGADVVPWAYAIARRVLIDSIRKGKRESIPSTPQMDHEQQAVDTPPDELLDSHRLAKRIETELSRLPESQRLAFELTQKEGLSLRDVAQMLGTSANAVKLRARRAYVAIRTAIDD